MPVAPESVPRQLDKKSGVPKEEEEKGVWGSQGGEKVKKIFYIVLS